MNLTARAASTACLTLTGLMVSPAGAAAPPAAESAPDDGVALELILDASGSMREPSGDGRTRFAAGIAGLRTVIGGLPSDLEVGLRIYGARIADGPGSCKDSRLEVPIGPADKPALRTALQRARAQGNTPLAYSLEQAARDLGDSGQRSIVLVSDGEESCGGDPCATARELTAGGVDVHVDVVGFQVSGSARNQLTCIAQAGRGTYYDTRTVDELSAALTRVSERATRPYAPRGVPIEGGRSAEDAPPIESGLWLDTLGDTGTEVYELPAADDAGTVHLSATTRPVDREADALEDLTLALVGADGSECRADTAVANENTDGRLPLTAALHLRRDDILRETCPSPWSLQVVPDDQADSVVPLEVSVVVEPQVGSPDSLPAKVEGGFGGPRPGGGAPQEATGSPAFSTAPVLDPGSYEDTLLLGEPLLYGVELDWGQSLTCLVQYAPSRAVRQESFTPFSSARLFGPMHDQVIDFEQSSDREQWSGEQPSDVWFTGPPVRWQNSEGLGGTVQAASLPGTYYCSAMVDAAVGTRVDNAEIPIVVTLEVSGEAGDGAPDFLAEEAAAPAASDEPSDEPSARPSAEPSDADGGADRTSGASDSSDASDEGGIPWVWLIVAFVLVDTAVLIWVLARRRRSGPPDPGRVGR